MKTIVSTAVLSFVFTLFAQHANAKIRRVGFFANQIANQDYISLQSAHDASSTGDTLLLFPGSWGATFSKKLIVIGYGYSASYLDSGLQTVAGTISVSLTVNNGSTGLIIRGIDALSMTVNAADTVTINRCNISSIVFASSNSSSTPGFKGWQVTQSVINNFYFYQFNNSYFYGPITNLLISNCIISYFSFGGVASGSCNGTLLNNIFTGGNNSVNYNNSSFSCANNVFLCPNFLNAAACTFYYNVATTSIIPPTNNNQINVSDSSIFVGYPNRGTYSYDSRYALAPGSPAKHGGEGGTDCGIFGGSIPYRLGGIPPIPSFYKLTSSSNIASTNPYKIVFSVKGNY